MECIAGPEVTPYDSFHCILYMIVDDKLSLSNGHVSEVESRVAVVRDRYTAMEENHFKLSEKLNRLKMVQKIEVSCFRRKNIIMVVLY